MGLATHTLCCCSPAHTPAQSLTPLQPLGDVTAGALLSVCLPLGFARGGPAQGVEMVWPAQKAAVLARRDLVEPGTPAASGAGGEPIPPGLRAPTLSLHGLVPLVDGY